MLRPYDIKIKLCTEYDPNMKSTKVTHGSGDIMLRAVLSAERSVSNIKICFFSFIGFSPHIFGWCSVI